MGGGVGVDGWVDGRGGEGGAGVMCVRLGGGTGVHGCTSMGYKRGKDGRQTMLTDGERSNLRILKKNCDFTFAEEKNH